MSEKDKKKLRADHSPKTEETEGKQSLRILSQIIALIVCIVLAFAIWLVVHYTADRRGESAGGAGEVGAAPESTIVSVV